MPAARPNKQHCGLRAYLIKLAFGRTKFNSARHRVAEIMLSLDAVGPRGRVRVLEVGHEDTGTRVESVDDHLPIGWAGNLHAAIEQVWGYRGHLPGGLPGWQGGIQELGQL